MKSQKSPWKKTIGKLIPERVKDLMSMMTLEEKIGQLNQYSGTWDLTGPAPSDEHSQQRLKNIQNGHVGSMLNVLTAEGTRKAQELVVEHSRLGIPLLFGYDVIHGYKTMFPVPLAQAASWDADVARSGNQIAAMEATADGVHWAFAPMVDISRDARWGRMMEGAGEDPYLTSVMAKAWVEGYQGEDLNAKNTLLACAKHFAAYGLAEAGRDYHQAEVSMNTLYNNILPPFKAALDAGVRTFMNSFNLINGVPASGSELLQRNILKGEWAFEGFVVSDWASLSEMIEHGYAEDEVDAGKKAISAGSDMDMEGYVYENSLAKLISEEKIDLALIEDAVRRILTVKFEIGIMDDPYKYCDADRQSRDILTVQNLNVARKAAQKSIVLLQNENNILPLTKNSPSIAVIGSLAVDKDIPLGSWRAQAVENSAVSVLEGIEKKLGIKIPYTDGYRLTKGKRDFGYVLNFIKGDHSGFANALELAKRHDLIILAMGEDCYQTGEGRSQVNVSLKGDQMDLFEKIIEINPNVVVVLSNGRALAIPELAEKAAAILEVWQLGSEAGNAIADVIFGDYNPSGRLPVSFPYHVGQCPIYYNHTSSGRPICTDGRELWSHYADAPKEAQFPFGFGLSYTEFEYSKPRISKSTMTTEDQIELSVCVKNIGQCKGKETVQFYLRDISASVVRPVKELKAFEQIELSPGEEKEVIFNITNETLSFYRSDLTFGSEPGKFTLMVGPNSKNLQGLEIELV